MGQFFQPVSLVSVFQQVTLQPFQLYCQMQLKMYSNARLRISAQLKRIARIQTTLTFLAS